MLKQLILNGYGEKEDFNCAEKILYGANEAYQLGMTKEAMRMAAGFGGGMGIGSVCGVLTACVMVLSHLFVKENAHESQRIKVLTQELFSEYQREMEELLCEPLKDRYRTEEYKCRYIIAKGAEVLDRIVSRERSCG